MRAFYEAINRRELDQAMRHIHPKGEIRPALEPVERVGVARGPIRGRKEVRRFFENLDSAWDEMTVEFKEIIDGADDRIIVVENWHVRSQQGIELDTELTDVYGFRDGLIIRGDGFRDRNEAIAAFARKE